MGPMGSQASRTTSVTGASVGSAPPSRLSSQSAAVPQRVVAEPPTAVPTDPAEEPLRRLKKRLLAEAQGDAVALLAVRGHLAAARAHFADATVRQFLPIARGARSAPTYAGGVGPG